MKYSVHWQGMNKAAAFFLPTSETNLAVSKTVRISDRKALLSQTKFTKTRHGS